MVQRLHLRGIKTPALLLDLDGLHANLQRMARYFRHSRSKLRPHFKGHQVLSLAAKQIEAGAAGITCARMEHAYLLAKHGVTDLLIANEIADHGTLAQWADLSRQAPVILAVDSPRIVADMARIVGAQRHNLNLVVDVDVGLGRCGVATPEAALALTKLILKNGMRFRGLMGYGGSIRLPPGLAKEEAVQAVLKPLLEAKRLVEAARIPVEIVSAGATGDYAISAASEVSEIQAGSYLLMDTIHSRYSPEFHRTLSVLGTVISKTDGVRVVADAGLKSLGLYKDQPQVKAPSGLRLRSIHAEHAILEMEDPSVPISVGDKIEIWVQHLDLAISLHSRMYGIKSEKVDEVFVIEH
jgi:D-serine deaminase-like pyridoxal phosphate-dependent protein